MPCPVLPCRVLAVLSGCTVPSFLSRLSCPSCQVPAFLYQLAGPGCPLVAVLS
jgi:hypothetical protein